MWVAAADWRQSIAGRRRMLEDRYAGFRGEEDADAVRDLLGELEHGAIRRVVFALPRGASWALPLYELTLLTATHVAEKRLAGVTLELVTPEAQPLAQFGGEVSATVSQLLRDRHIGVHLSTYPVRVYGDRLMLAPARTLPVDRVVCMPEARGVAIAGLPHGPDGFLPTDLLGQVAGPPDVYAVGDITLTYSPSVPVPRSRTRRRCDSRSADCCSRAGHRSTSTPT